MKSGICPKCGQSSVVAQSLGVKLGDDSRGVFVFVGMMGTASAYTSYVCTTCGFFENYLDDRAKLAKISESWARVIPPTGGPPPIA